MNALELKVSCHRLTILNRPALAAGSVHIDSCSFAFDGEWEGFYRTAVFFTEEGEVYRTPLIDDGCMIPYECLRSAGALCIGVFGENGVSRITTNTVVCYIPEGSYSAGADAARMEGDHLVRFIDYDGRVLLETMCANGEAVRPPSRPAAKGLVFCGWNHNEEELSSVTRDLTVGALYKPADGSTRLCVELTPSSGLSLTLYFWKSDSSTLTVNWGDGVSSTSTSTVSGNGSLAHTYDAEGEYVISLSITSGNGRYALGYPSASKAVFGDSSLSTVIRWANICAEVGNCALQYASAMEYVTMSDDVPAIGSYGLSYCFALKAVVLPRTVTSLPSYCMASCRQLLYASLPATLLSLGSRSFWGCINLLPPLHGALTSMDTYCCDGCEGLSDITLPAGVTAVPQNAFNSCYGMRRVRLHGDVASIAASAFANARRMERIVIEAQTPPTLANTNAFSNLSKRCRIYVPDASLNTYKAAANWSTYAAHMRPMSELE